jgi:hypothetical protein
MKTDSVPTERGEREPPSYGIGTVLFVVVLTILLYLLVSSMMGHHFFKGGHPHRPTPSLIRITLHTCI